MRDDEILKLAEALKEITFSEPDQIMTLFNYGQNDSNERHKIALEVAKEYHEGKLDP